MFKKVHRCSEVSLASSATCFFKRLSVSHEFLLASVPLFLMSLLISHMSSKCSFRRENILTCLSEGHEKS